MTEQNARQAIFHDFTDERIGDVLQRLSIYSGMVKGLNKLFDLLLS